MSLNDPLFGAVLIAGVKWKLTLNIGRWTMHFWLLKGHDDEPTTERGPSNYGQYVCDGEVMDECQFKPEDHTLRGWSYQVRSRATGELLYQIDMPPLTVDESVEERDFDPREDDEQTAEELGL